MKNSSSALLVLSIIIIVVCPILALITSVLNIGYLRFPNAPEFGIRLPLIAILASVIAGILGIVSWKKSKRAIICIVVGIIILVCWASHSTYLFLYGTEPFLKIGGVLGYTLFVFVINSVIPVCYTMIAYKFWKLSRQGSIAKETEEMSQL